MPLKDRLARELARALLSGPSDHASAIQRCALVLDQNPVWLRFLIRSVRSSFATAWNAGSHPAMSAAILAAPIYQHAWLCEPHPRLRRPVLASLSMAPRPWVLADCALPNLSGVGDVADWLDLPLSRLDWLAGVGFRPDKGDAEALRHYRYRWLDKRSGGQRLLEIPKPELRAIQRRILHELLEYIPPHEAAQGFRRGHSCLSNAEIHVGCEVVVHFDLQDFFLHVRGGRVSGLFRSLGYSEETACVLAGLCTNRAPSNALAAGGDYQPTPDLELRKRYLSPHLPQGAPTSPTLANLCAFRLDLRLGGLAECLGGNYSRYADDLIFSGGRELAGAMARFMPLVGAIVLEEGFVLNHRKTRVMRQGARQTVTGVVVNRRPNLVRADYDVLKATLHNCVRHGPGGQNHAGHADYRAHLLGRIAHVGQIHPQRGERLLALFRRIVWE